MNLVPYSFDGHTLNSANVIESIFVDESRQADSEQGLAERPFTSPIATYKTLHEHTRRIGITLLGTTYSRDTVCGWFNTSDGSGLKTLIARDADNSDKLWYVQCTCIDQTKDAPPNLEFIVLIPDPVWYSNTNNSDEWSIVASGATHTVTPAGNVNCQPVITIKPTNSKTADFAYKRYRPIYNPTSRAFPDYGIDITNGGLDTATLIGAAKMQADGDDCRVYVDGVEVERWFGTGANDINQAATKIWISLSLSPKIELTESGAIAGAGSISTITFKSTAANLSALKSLPTAGILCIANEVFTYTGKSISSYTVTGVTRAAKGTTAAAHSDGDTVRWIEHDIWLLYGNSSLTAPSYTDAKKPAFALTSTNTSWVYTSFNSDARSLSGAWPPAKLKGNGTDTNYYTGSHGAIASPATEMGMQVKAFIGNNNRVQPDNGMIEWRLYHPAGITTVTSAGDIRREQSDWPTAVLQKSTDGINWTTQFTLSTPGSSGAWTAWTKNAEALGATYNYIRYLFSGAVSSIASNAVYFEVQGATLTLDSNNVPVIGTFAEQSNYHLSCTITNTTTGKSFTVTATMDTNQSIEVDCVNQTVTYLKDNSIVPLFTLSTSRNDWFDLQAGANVLQFDDVGTQAVTVTTTYRERNN